MANLQASTVTGFNYGNLISAPCGLNSDQQEYPQQDPWGNFTNLSANCSVKKFGDWVDLLVQIDGIAESSAPGWIGSRVLYTLPTGYRPTGYSNVGAPRPAPYDTVITTGWLRVAGDTNSFGGDSIRHSGALEVRVSGSDGTIRAFYGPIGADTYEGNAANPGGGLTPGTTYQIRNNNSWFTFGLRYWAGVTT
jgi:hypothetical protein